MKKLLLMLLCCTMLVGFSACEQPNPPSHENENQEEIANDPVEITCTLTLSVNDESMGSVVGAGEYESCSEVTITAKANDGYYFTKWSDGNMENPRILYLCSDTTLVAFFTNDKSCMVNEYYAVDLGLPSGTLWASRNIGATVPEACGDYFAWGEVEPKETYTMDNYKWGTWESFTKYNEVDGKGILDASDDAARVNLGSPWRTPTNLEWRELADYCTWSWQTTPARGFLVVGHSGNSIFLPATGIQSKTWGEYWSSELYSTVGVYDYNYAYFTYIIPYDEGHIEVNSFNGNSREYGFAIRPVCSTQQ